MFVFMLHSMTMTAQPTLKNERVLSVESYLGLSAYMFLQSTVSYHALELVRQLGNFWPSITTALMFLPSHSNWSIIIVFLVVLCLSMVSQKWKSDFHISCTCIAFLQDFMLLGWNHYGGYILFFYFFILGQDTVLFIWTLCAEGKDLLLLLMDQAMWHLKRAVELVVCKPSWAG